VPELAARSAEYDVSADRPRFVTERDGRTVKQSMLTVAAWRYFPRAERRGCAVRWRIVTKARRRILRPAANAASSRRADRPSAEVAALERLVAEQSALRRVATAVARGVSPSVAFRTVAGEVGTLLRADHTSINRYEPDDTISVVAQWSAPDVASHLVAPRGGRIRLGDDSASAIVRATGKPSRRASESVGGDLGAWLRSQEIGYVVASPIMLTDRLWGTVTAFFEGREPPPADIEERMAEFVELTGCTIAQAEDRAELIASRSRVVTAADAARRRFERDLHDGAQQQLVALTLELRAAEREVGPGPLRERLATTAEGLTGVLAELQKISRGLHPAILSQGGLRRALKSLADRSSVPVHVVFHGPERLPDQIEVTIYYIVSEALTNVLKHAGAFNVRVTLTVEEDTVRLSVRDDGIGGADLSRGSGLIGLIDRVRALGGTMTISSPMSGGTTLVSTIPLARD
jgi:signal transduction histidine kinase